LFAANRVMRYLKGTLDYGILFHVNAKASNMKLVAYSDADLCGDKRDKKSTFGY